MQLSLHEILQPAIDLAESGFPVAPVAAFLWNKGSADLLRPGNSHGVDLLLNGKPPRAGEIIKMPHLAKTFRVGDCTDAMAIIMHNWVLVRQ